MSESEKSERQDRWNEFGIARRLDIEQHPERYRISECPLQGREFYDQLVDLLNPLQGKQLLELGCGRGDLSVWLALQGAEVTAVDLGRDLVSAAVALSNLNGVSCDFHQGNMTDLGGIAAGRFDLVCGMAVLHHLSEPDVSRTLRECHRVLRSGGAAIFVEPVENSRWFDLIQSLIPAGEPNGTNYRPSILSRRRWKDYVAASDDRAMTDRELSAAGQGLFRATQITSYGLLIRLVRLLGHGFSAPLMAIDRFLFRRLPALKRYSRTSLVVYTK